MVWALSHTRTRTTNAKCQRQRLGSVLAESRGGGLPLAFQDMANVLASPKMSLESQRLILQIAPVTDARNRYMVVVGTAVLATKWAQMERPEATKKVT